MADASDCALALYHLNLACPAISIPVFFDVKCFQQERSVILQAGCPSTIHLSVSMNAIFKILTFTIKINHSSKQYGSCVMLKTTEYLAGMASLGTGGHERARRCSEYAKYF